MPKLFDLPRTETGTLVRLRHNNQVVVFYHIDGMYSYCKTLRSEVVHVGCTAKCDVVSVFDLNEKELHHLMISQLLEAA